MGNRMKGYEAASDYVLPSRMPIIVRLDGNSFSKLTKKLDKPFDVNFRDWMNKAAIAVLEYCSGSQFAYVQSDEISILLRNDMTIQTDPFLSNRVQKLCSLLSSTCSLAFTKASGMDAIFDCRVFVIPESDVNNAFLWRQRDAFKNCVSSYCYWSLGKKIGKKTAAKRVDGVSTNSRQEVLFQELGINVNDLPDWQKRGTLIAQEKKDVLVRDVVDQETFAKLMKLKKATAYSKFTRNVWVPKGAPRFEGGEVINPFLETVKS